MLTYNIMVKASKMGRMLSDREGKAAVLGNTTAELRVATAAAPPCQTEQPAALVNQNSRRPGRKPESGILPQEAPLSREDHLPALQAALPQPEVAFADSSREQ